MWNGIINEVLIADNGAGGFFCRGLKHCPLWLILHFTNPFLISSHLMWEQSYNIVSHTVYKHTNVGHLLFDCLFFFLSIVTVPLFHDFIIVLVFCELWIFNFLIWRLYLNDIVSPSAFLPLTASLLEKSSYLKWKGKSLDLKRAVWWWHEERFPDVCLSQFQRSGPVTLLGSGWKEASSPSPVETGQRNCIRGGNPLLPDLLQQSQRSPPHSVSSPSSPALSPLSPSDRHPYLAEVEGLLSVS